VREGTRREAAAMVHFAEPRADEGGLGFALPTNRAALELLCAGITAAALHRGPMQGLPLTSPVSLPRRPATYFGQRSASWTPRASSASSTAGAATTRSSRLRIPLPKTIGLVGSWPLSA
jgi:hypothetical protein